MKTITTSINNEFIIKNSKFITILFPIKNTEEIKKYLEEVKLLYPKATHYTYAYKYNDIKKSSDDNEPSGTAGIPMLNILDKENINNILVVTVRYFGGIKLGAGGLLRAYSKSLCLALDKAILKELTKGYLVEITFSYEKQKEINILLKDMTITSKEFLDNIKFLVEIPKDKITLLEKYNYKILEEISIIK